MYIYEWCFECTHEFIYEIDFVMQTKLCKTCLRYFCLGTFFLKMQDKLEVFIIIFVIQLYMFESLSK